MWGMRRRVQRTTTGTYFITLPKDWVRQHNIDHGAMLEIEIRRDGALVVHPPVKEAGEADKVSVRYSRGQMAALKDLILGAYLLGYNLIEITSSDGEIDPKDREEIRRIIHSFVGLEVLDEDARKMVIRSILDPFYTDPVKLLNRMAYLVEDMLKDGFRAIIEGDTRMVDVLMQRDDEVDRIYFLLIRLLRGALRNPSLADRYPLSPVDYLDYRVAAKIIETVGDIVSNLHPYVDRPIQDDDIKALLDDVLRIYKLSIKVFFTRDDELRGQLKKLVEDVGERLEPLKKRKRNVYDLVRWLIAESIDIADLAISIPS